MALVIYKNYSIKAPCHNSSLPKTVVKAPAKKVSMGVSELGPAISNPVDVIRYIKPAFELTSEQEQFRVIFLDGSNKIIGHHLCTLGFANSTQVHPRESFKEAIRKNAVAVIFAHNHPSGSLRPSPEDIKVTAQLMEVGLLLEIPMLDHLILSTEGWHSIKATHPHLFRS